MAVTPGRFSRDGGGEQSVGEPKDLTRARRRRSHLVRQNLGVVTLFSRIQQEGKQPGAAPAIRRETRIGVAACACG